MSPSGEKHLAKGRALFASGTEAGEAPEKSLYRQAGLLAAALHHLMHYSLTGCNQSASRVDLLLETLADLPEVDMDTRALCLSMQERLGLTRAEAGHV